MTTKPTDDWRSDYCKQFGLCKAGGKCQCKKELAFIEKAIKSARQQAYIEGAEAALEKFKRLDDLTYSIQMENNGNKSYEECELGAYKEIHSAIKALLP